MAFVKEYPVSQELLNRFDWTALPLLYQGEAGEYCSIPTQLLVDYDEDLIYYIGGGGVGRTTRIIQPDTEVLYFKGIPVRFIQEVTETKSHKDELLRGFVIDWMSIDVIRIVVPLLLKEQEISLIKAIKLACEIAYYNKPFTKPKDVTVKISAKVEYI